MPKSKLIRPDYAPRLHRERMELDLHTIDGLRRFRVRSGDLVPAGWQTVHEDPPCAPAKTKLTIRLDADILEWYRKIGVGYHKRMNTVLRANMDSVLSRFIEPMVDYVEIGPRE